MDTVKIGKYIAQKRKNLGLTQREIAEQLGMSDKSVSKWERGVCLPDVSVYMELCRIIGISLNEFIAGEDIEQVELQEKSEQTLTFTPGEIVEVAKKYFVISCGEGALRVRNLQPEGKKAMDTSAYLNGNPLKPGMRAGEER